MFARTICALLLLAGAALAQDDHERRQAKAVAYAKTVSVSALDNRLPRQPLGTWLSRMFPRARMNWELNDCGEGGDRDPVGTPSCVEVQLAQPDGREGSLSVVIGSYPDLIRGKPSVWWVMVKTAGQYKPLKRLSDLPGALR